jgi:hypothetical protein
VNIPTPHPVQWVTPAPLWGPATAGAAGTTATGPTPQMMEPALLTIADDNFMTALGATLAGTPANLQSLVAVAKSYRVRPPGRADDWEPPGAAPPLKLYQAAHGQFNLVAASLICQLPGLPEHRVHPELKERVSFVLRRHDAGGESAWTTGATGKQWRSITPGKELSVTADEQLLPMFPVSYATEGRPRTLLVGLVPTSSVETFKTAASTTAPASPPLPPPPSDLISMAFHTRVSGPLAQLITNVPDGDSRVLGSAPLVLEFASFLNDWFPTSWAAAVAGGAAAVPGQSLFGHLESTTAGTTVATNPDGSPVAGPQYVTAVSWLGALTAAWEQADWLSGEPSATVPAQPLALDLNQPANPIAGPPLPPIPPICTQLEGWIAAATPEGAAASGTVVPGAALATAPKLVPDGPQGNAHEYLIRCVYQRPECVLVGPTVSAPTTDFQIASYFDFDAPARPVTISLPHITGLADLRKFRKNVNFLLSQELHAQMDRIIDLKNTMNGTLNPPPAGGGGGGKVNWICSFSIPIVTICALLVLIMFVIMLNLLFFWLPFFEICLPVPE